MRRRWPVVLAALVMTAAAAPAVARQSGPEVTVPAEPRSWRERAALMMDHDSLGPALREHGYRWASNQEIYAVEIVPGVGQPALVMFDAGQGAFSQNFWPASSVKLLAAVAALEFVGSLGYAGDADLSAGWLGERTLRSIYQPAVVRSDNRAYDLLVRIAGIDFINLEFAPAHGLDSVTIGSDLSGLSVVSSPAYALTEWWPAADIPVSLGPYVTAIPVRTTVPSRSATRAYRSNNLDLFDLAEVVRRVMLHGELPDEHRFDIDGGDVEALVAALCSSQPSHYRSGAVRVLGDDAQVCGKSGWWDRTPEEGEEEPAPPPPPSCTDVALITGPGGGRRVLLAATGGCSGAGLASLAAPALEALEGLSGAPLQLDGGVPIDAAADVSDGMLRVTVDTGPTWVLVRVDRGAPVLAAARDGRLEALLPMPPDGPHLVSITALSYGVPVGYRALDIDVDGA